MQQGENAFVDWLAGRFAVNTGRVPIGIGDDMAAVLFDGRLVTITSDMLLDGVHFDTQKHSYEAIGRKALACSLSDCAAMGCDPRCATISLAVNQGLAIDDLHRLYEGIAKIAVEFDCFIVGGDTNSWPAPLAIDVTMMAEPMAPRGPITRAGARVGDTLYVSGKLGGSILGHHLTFTPRLALAEQLVHEPELHAMIDLSDGLALDLYRMCMSSGCDAELRADQLDAVISQAAKDLSRTSGRAAIEHALSDGEDFELLIAGGAGLGRTEAGVFPVGQIVARRAGHQQTTLTLLEPDGQSRELEPRGYEHKI